MTSQKQPAARPAPHRETVAERARKRKRETLLAQLGPEPKTVTEIAKGARLKAHEVASLLPTMTEAVCADTEADPLERSWLRI